MTPSPTLFCQPSTRPEEIKDLHCSLACVCHFDYFELLNRCYIIVTYSNYRVVKGGVPRGGGSLIFPKVPQSSLGILRVPQLPPPLNTPPLGTLQSNDMLRNAACVAFICTPVLWFVSTQLCRCAAFSRLPGAELVHDRSRRSEQSCLFDF